MWYYIKWDYLYVSETGEITKKSLRYQQTHHLQLMFTNRERELWLVWTAPFYLRPYYWSPLEAFAAESLGYLYYLLFVIHIREIVVNGFSNDALSLGHHTAADVHN